MNKITSILIISVSLSSHAMDNETKEEKRLHEFQTIVAKTQSTECEVSKGICKYGSIPAEVATLTTLGTGLYAGVRTNFAGGVVAGTAAFIVTAPFAIISTIPAGLFGALSGLKKEFEKRVSNQCMLQDQQKKVIHEFYQWMATIDVGTKYFASPESEPSPSTLLQSLSEQEILALKKALFPYRKNPIFPLTKKDFETRFNYVVLIHECDEESIEIIRTFIKSITSL